MPPFHPAGLVRRIAGGSRGEVDQGRRSYRRAYTEGELSTCDHFLHVTRNGRHGGAFFLRRRGVVLKRIEQHPNKTLGLQRVFNEM